MLREAHGPEFNSKTQMSNFNKMIVSLVLLVAIFNLEYSASSFIYTA